MQKKSQNLIYKIITLYITELSNIWKIKISHGIIKN